MIGELPINFCINDVIEDDSLSKGRDVHTLTQRDDLFLIMHHAEFDLWFALIFYLSTCTVSSH